MLENLIYDFTSVYSWQDDSRDISFYFIRIWNGFTPPCNILKWLCCLFFTQLHALPCPSDTHHRGLISIVDLKGNMVPSLQECTCNGSYTSESLMAGLLDRTLLCLLGDKVAFSSRCSIVRFVSLVFAGSFSGYILWEILSLLMMTSIWSQASACRYEMTRDCPGIRVLWISEND